MESDHQRNIVITISFMIVIWMGLFCSSSQAHLNFYVGGKDGWVLAPSESYNHWAQRNRFQVNDSLIFNYKQGSDSVLVVNKDDYHKCNKAQPTQSLQDGVSIFTFHRSGPFFFISGHADNCEYGQKLVIVVLAVRNTTRGHGTPPLPPTPTPSSNWPPSETPAWSPAGPDIPAWSPAPAPSADTEVPPPPPPPPPTPTQTQSSPSPSPATWPSPEGLTGFEEPAPAPAPSAAPPAFGGFLLGLIGFVGLGFFLGLI